MARKSNMNKQIADCYIPMDLPLAPRRDKQAKPTTDNISAETLAMDEVFNFNAGNAVNMPPAALEDNGAPKIPGHTEQAAGGLFDFGSSAFRVEYGVFNIRDDTEKKALEAIMNNVLDSTKKWVLAEQQMRIVDSGDVFVAVKVLIPGSKKSQAASDDAPDSAAAE